MDSPLLGAGLTGSPTGPAADYDWFMNQPDLRARYAGLLVILRNRVVLGSGSDHAQALEDARRRATEEKRPLTEHGLLFVPVPESTSFDGE
jgi:hypothetical protein